MHDVLYSIGGLIMSEVFEYLNGTTFYVATVDGNKPRVRPFGFVMELNEKLYFGHNNSKTSYRQLMENPNIEICACKDGKHGFAYRAR
jgi:uncharacterized pyridoxamine 5'-phosphate oxidase family protein